MVGNLSSGRLLTAFGIVSLATVLAGVAICVASGAPLAPGLRNVAAWAVGAGAALAIAAWVRREALPIFLWLAPLGLLAGFLGPGLQGVHRWLAFGPLNVNVAMLLAPAAIVAFAARMQASPRSSWVAFLAALVLTIAQPDASQASTLALVGLLATWRLEARPFPRLLLAAVAALTVLAAR